MDGGVGVFFNLGAVDDDGAGDGDGQEDRHQRAHGMPGREARRQLHGSRIVR